MIKGIDISKSRMFTDEKRLNARIWKTVLIEQGEKVVWENLKQVFCRSTLDLFPRKLTPENLEFTFLNLTSENIKYKKTLCPIPIFKYPKLLEKWAKSIRRMFS